MKKIALESVLIVSALVLGGMAPLSAADDAVPSAVTAEVKDVKDADDGTEAPAKADTPAGAASPAAPAAAAKPPAATKPKSKAEEALQKAAEEDPDVAARMETPYPLEGDEWKEYPLGVLEMEMQEVIEDLGNGKSKPPSLVTQPRIIARLDTLIEELEKKMGQGSGTGPGNGGMKPAESSTLRQGQMKDGTMRAAKNEGNRWADIPPKEREKILQSQGEGFPAGYEDVLADYFRKLSKSEKPAATPPPEPQGTK